MPKPTAVKMVGDLDGDFGMRRVQDDEHGVPDDRPRLVVSYQPEAPTAHVRRPVRSPVGVDATTEEPQTPRFRAQAVQEDPQRRLITGP